MAGRVAVVGAGLAGLSAAVELKRRGFEVEVFERSRLLGGRATSFTVDGVEVDNGQHVYLGCCTDWRAFVDELGLADKLYLQPRFEVLLLSKDGPPTHLRASRLPSPWHLLPILLGYRRLSWPGRARLGWALVRAREAPPSSETLDGWLERHHQGEVERRCFWEPFLVPALNAPLDQVAAAAGTFVVNTAFLGDPGGCRIGYSTVPLARIAEAAANLADRVHLRTPVAGLLVRGGALTGIRLADGSERPFDAVVLAVPPRVAARLLGEPVRLGVHGLEEFRPQPIVDVHLWYDRASLGFDFAAVLDSPVQWVFQKADGYLCCSLSAATDFKSRSEPELADLCSRELAAALPEIRSASLVRSAVTREPEATFVAAPRLHRPGALTSLENLTLAGDWTDTGWPATMESAVRSGRAAALALAARELGRAA